MDHFVKKTMAEVEDITAEIDKKTEVGFNKSFVLHRCLLLGFHTRLCLP